MRGRWAEEEALRFLLGKGYRLLWRNRRTPFGEVDLFMEKDGVYVVVEVKQAEVVELEDHDLLGLTCCTSLLCMAFSSKGSASTF